MYVHVYMHMSVLSSSLQTHFEVRVCLQVIYSQPLKRNRIEVEEGTGNKLGKDVLSRIIVAPQIS